MNSLPRKELNQILNETLRLLNARTIRQGIDEAVDAAASTFKHVGCIPVGNHNAALIEAAGEFIAHIYRHGLACPRSLAPDQAKAEALFLLEHSCQGTNADGYEEALRDTVKYGAEGLRAALRGLADIIKQTQRQQYISWVLNTRVRQLDWNTRKDLAALIIERWGICLDDDIAQSSPTALACACAELILDYVASDESLRQVMGMPYCTSGARRLT